MRTGSYIVFKKKKQVNEAQPQKKQERSEKLEQLAAFLNKYALIYHFVLAFVLYFLIEAMSRHSLAEAAVFMVTHKKVYLYNTLMIYLSLTLVFLTRRRSFARIFISFIWFLMGAVNGLVLASRVTPLTGQDMRTIQEGLSILPKYRSNLEVALFCVILVFVIIGLVRAFRNAPKYGKKIKYALNVPLVLVAFAAFYGLTVLLLRANILTNYFDNLANSYKEYGFPYCFTVSVLDTGISEPNSYTKEAVEELVDKIDDGTTNMEVQPNIIVVQLETFFDPTRVNWLNFNQDPLPNWHELSKKYTSVYFEVPVVGAGTINTEFAVQTGMSLRYFGAGELPYKTILSKRVCDSAAYELNTLGYRPTAIHNNEANFYSRRTVFSRLGYFRFVSEEYMDTQDDVNEGGWMRDRNLVGPINDALDVTSSSRDFVFVVSVQPHGAFPVEQAIEAPAIDVSGTATDEAHWQWEYYVNQLYEEDAFVKQLIESVEARNEPSVILFYGDHLPTLGLSNGDLNGGTIYQTDYLIWDNIGLKHERKDVAAYQVMAEIFDDLNIHQGVMFNFHQNMKDDPEYNYYMQMLQYDLLYGKRYSYYEQFPFRRTNMLLGTKRSRAISVDKINDETYTVSGVNFTQSSKVLVFDNDKENPADTGEEDKGELLDTIFIDSQTLLVKTDEPLEGKIIQVATQSNSSTHRILSTYNRLGVPEGDAIGISPIVNPDAYMDDGEDEGDIQADPARAPQQPATP